MKRLVAFLLAALMVMSFAACAASTTEPEKEETQTTAPAAETETEQAPAEETTASEDNVGDGLEISLATVIPDGTPIVLGLNNVSETLNDAGFQTSVFPAGQLGSLVDVMDRCLAGENTIMTCDPADLADITVSDMAIVQAPFLYDSWEDMDKLFSSDWWQGICKAAEDAGMKIIASIINDITM